MTDAGNANEGPRGKTEYKVYVECRNCGYGDNGGFVKKYGENLEDVSVDVPMGTEFNVYKEQIKCANCGCKGTFDKK